MIIAQVGFICCVILAPALLATPVLNGRPPPSASYTLRYEDHNWNMRLPECFSPTAPPTDQPNPLLVAPHADCLQAMEKINPQRGPNYTPGPNGGFWANPVWMSGNCLIAANIGVGRAGQWSPSALYGAIREGVLSILDYCMREEDSVLIRSELGGRFRIRSSDSGGAHIVVMVVGGQAPQAVMVVGSEAPQAANDSTSTS